MMLTARKIQIWTGGKKNGFRAIRMTLFDGQTFTAGRVPASGPNGEYTFSEGEHLVGDYIICGNGRGTRAGYLEFKTSKGKTFKVGTMHTPFYFKSNDSFFTGMHGNHSSEIL